MPNPKIRIHDIVTNEIIDREMNADELAQYKLDQAEIVAKKADELATATSKAALLTKLGITADEAALLLT